MQICAFKTHRLIFFLIKTKSNSGWTHSPLMIFPFKFMMTLFSEIKIKSNVRTVERMGDFDTKKTNMCILRGPICFFCEKSENRMTNAINVANTIRTTTKQEHVEKRSKRQKNVIKFSVWLENNFFK